MKSVVIGTVNTPTQVLFGKRQGKSGPQNACCDLCTVPVTAVREKIRVSATIRMRPTPSPERSAICRVWCLLPSTTRRFFPVTTPSRSDPWTSYQLHRASSPSVPIRSTRETLESLRLVLRRLQLSRDPAWDTRSLVELERILRKRIACLEAADARERRASDRWAA